MFVLADWSSGNTVLVVIGVVVLIVLIVLMSTRKPGPQGPRQSVGNEDVNPQEDAPEVEDPEAEQ